jgi:hypothetical protein
MSSSPTKIDNGGWKLFEWNGTMNFVIFVSICVSIPYRNEFVSHTWKTFGEFFPLILVQIKRICYMLNCTSHHIIITLWPKFIYISILFQHVMLLTCEHVHIVQEIVKNILCQQLLIVTWVDIDTLFSISTFQS